MTEETPKGKLTIRHQAYQRRGVEPVPSELMGVHVNDLGELQIRVDTGHQTIGSKGHDVRIMIPVEVFLEWAPEMLAKKHKALKRMMDKIHEVTKREANRLNHENAHLRRQLAIANEKHKTATQDAEHLKVELAEAKGKIASLNITKELNKSLG